MKEKETSPTKNKIRTYISEANQNNIRDTLSVESKQALPSTQDEQSYEVNAQVSEAGTAPTSPSHLSGEAELLHPQSFVWPPTSATAEAEAVAGLPIGDIPVEEEVLNATVNNSSTESKKQE